MADTRAPRADAPRRLDDDETVAVLAAALRGETLPTRVSLLEGGRDDDVATEADDEPPALSTGHLDFEIDLRDDGITEDPLRAALEELQRVSARDDDPIIAVGEATPLRRDMQARGPASASTGDDGLTLW